MAGLNGNTKWVITILTFVIVVGTAIIGVTNAISGKAEHTEVESVCSRVTVVETEQANHKDDLREIKAKVDKIYDMLLEEKGK